MYLFIYLLHIIPHSHPSLEPQDVEKQLFAESTEAWEWPTVVLGFKSTRGPGLGLV